MRRVRLASLTPRLRVGIAVGGCLNTALNIRARADLILDGTLKPGPEITLPRRVCGGRG